MASTPTYKNLGTLVEQPDSGTLESNRSGVSLTKTYRAEYAVAYAAVKVVGTIGSGDTSGFVIESSVCTKERGGMGKLVDRWVFGGAAYDPENPEFSALPPDEVGVTPDNMNPRIGSHKDFARLVTLRYTDGDYDNSIMGLIDDAIRATNSDERRRYVGFIRDVGNEAVELYELMLRGVESYYLASFRYSWATHSYVLENTTRGGFREVPQGPLAGYFVNQIGWLREADGYQYSNGIWRLTKTWLGGPDGMFAGRAYNV